MNTATYETLSAMMTETGKPVPFEIWENGGEVFGFISEAGLHFCSSEKARDIQIAK